MSDIESGREFTFMLVSTFRKIIDDLHAYLADEGFAHVRPIQGFALQAIGDEAVSITELGRRLGVTKQAAAKTVKMLEACNLVTREPDPNDARASVVRRSERGEQLLRASTEFYRAKQLEWNRQIGEARFSELVDDLAAIGGTDSAGGFVGWLQSSPASDRE